MCGIAGVYNKHGGQVSNDIVTKIGRSMVHRGPDHFGVDARASAAMVHNRLSLIDLSEEANQPFKNGNFSLTFNGEIYNFEEIRSRLTAEYGVKFATSSDTEVLFYSLIYDGIDKCLAGLRGMFAFAFYDTQKHRLILARDRMGIKPLYFYETAEKVYWASEVKALATGLDLKPDPVRTLFSVNNMAEKSIEHTLFKGLKSVHPGCFITLNTNDRPRNTVYYDLLDDFDQDLYQDLGRRPSSAVVAEFEEIFTSAVRSTLICDAPIGAFVSGGIDSSLIAAVAVKENADLKLFTANIIGKYSEFPDVEILGRHIGKQVFDYRFEPEMMLRDWVDVTYFYDCPVVVHVNSIPFSNVARLARDTGVKAVLTGEGADELFLGYPRLLARRYESVATFPIRALKSIYKLSPKLHDYLFPEQSKTPLAFINNIVQGLELPQLLERTGETFAGLRDQDRYEQHLTIKMIREHLVTLLHRSDRMGMMYSVEARFPFLDESLVKFAINLPSKFKIGRSSRLHNYKHPFLIDKWIVREMARKYLPDSLVHKKKNGLPMWGHKFIRIDKGFFEDGWVAEQLGMCSDKIDFLLTSQDPYFVAKLASVEIFGRLFSHGTSRETVKAHVLKYATISPA